MMESIPEAFEEVGCFGSALDQQIRLDVCFKLHTE